MKNTKHQFLLIFFIVIFIISFIFFKKTPLLVFYFFYFKKDIRINVLNEESYINPIKINNISKIINHKLNLNGRYPKDIGDFDRDNKKDLIEANPIFNLKLSKGKRILFHLFSNIKAVGFFDIDLDGYIDFWYYEISDNYIDIFWGNKNGKIGGMQRILLKSTYSYVLFNDIDNDKNNEIILYRKSKENGEQYYIIKTVNIKNRNNSLK
ncbi:MAG: VCBS repeat-containing protein [bacterium]|nr:VCBS repeat-containing protein [bacterium]